MNYKKFFSDELISLKSQGLYRKFRAINRNNLAFLKPLRDSKDRKEKLKFGAAMTT